MNTPICSRSFDLLHPDGATSQIRVILCLPVLDIVKDLPDAWACVVIVEDLDRTFEKRIFGEDSLQALMIALKILAVEIEYLTNLYGNALTLFGQHDLILSTSSGSNALDLDPDDFEEEIEES